MVCLPHFMPRFLSKEPLFPRAAGQAAALGDFGFPCYLSAISFVISSHVTPRSTISTIT